MRILRLKTVIPASSLFTGVRSRDRIVIFVDLYHINTKCRNRLFFRVSGTQKSSSEGDIDRTECFPADYHFCFYEALVLCILFYKM